MIKKFWFNLIASMVLCTVSCGGESELWCFTGRLDEFRCHPTRTQCEEEREAIWRRFIVMGWGNPLPCEEF